MNIIKYNSEEHRPQLEHWYSQWNIPTYSLELLSDTGLIIPNIACMFIYETNSPMVLFENLVSNKDISSYQRDKAIKYLVNCGKQYVKDRGYKTIMLTTNNLSILDRAFEDNCDVSDEKFFVVFKEV